MSVFRIIFLLILLAGAAASASEDAADSRVLRGFIQKHCRDCHNTDEKTAGLDLHRLSRQPLTKHARVWEGVVRKLRSRQMPPADAPRPAPTAYAKIQKLLEGQLDRAAAKDPHPGRTAPLRRLTRTQYQNAIRDLLALDIEASRLLPPDESSHGFDNITVTELSPTLLNRYISAAQEISRLAMGGSRRAPASRTIRLPADLTQEEHVVGLPIGTRGGTLIAHHFPKDGEYDVRMRLARDRNEEIEGLRGTHQLELLLDRQRMAIFSIRRPADKNFSNVDANLNARIRVSAGPHKLGVTFLKLPSSLIETKRQPYHAHFNMHRHPRMSPAIYQISITGPYAAQGRGETPSRRRILVVRPGKPDEEEDCAKRILTNLMLRAYRRPINSLDLQKPMQFFRQGRKAVDFDAGIELALTSILLNPHFLFQIERDPDGVADSVAYQVPDLTLASRLSFFMWSSIPDDELRGVAGAGELRKPEILERQVRRLLSYLRSRSLVTNFAAQWLYLRNLESIKPNLRLFPDFDDNLRRSFREETERFVESIIREDRSVLDLLRADYTYLNERLAKHYEIPHIYGSRFRRVKLGDDRQRGGLLRHGSILTVTSYATRTSPVIRGHWILKNLLGAPPPPPPANVPALKENTIAADLTVRERLAAHRANPACAGCHQLMDPVGFALENYDAVGRWREFESGKRIDASGSLPDGHPFDGVAGLERHLTAQPELFVGTLAEKLLTFALGRIVTDEDAPAIRQIVREAKAHDYRFSAVILAVVKSPPFQMRMTSRAVSDSPQAVPRPTIDKQK